MTIFCSWVLVHTFLILDCALSWNFHRLFQANKSLRFLISARVTSDPRVGIYFNFKFCLAMKIAGSIGILPCCALNDFFHIGVWTFGYFVRPLFLATILFAGKKKMADKKTSASPHRWWPETGAFLVRIM